MQQFKVPTKYELIKEHILTLIEEQDINNNQLPSEEFLARKFGVSLATVRQALLLLKKEGIVSKKHGSGNFIHRSVLNSYMRVDKFVDFIQLLEASGYEVNWDQTKTDFLTIGREQHQMDLSLMGVHEDDNVIHYERIFYADGIPAVYAHNMIPARFYTVGLEEVEKVERISDYMWIYCEREITHALLEFQPMAAGNKEIELFKLDKGEPMIAWKEIFYTLEDDPICLSKVMFNPSVMTLRMLWNC